MAFDPVKTVRSSAALTSTANGTAMPSPVAKFLNLLVDVTAITGSSPTMDIDIKWSHDGTTFASTDGTADTFAQMTGTGTKIKSFQVKAPYYRPTYTISSSDVDEVQTVTLTDGPTDGTFTLTFDGDTTSALDHDASAGAVETALNALDSIGADGVAVSRGGSGTQAAPYVYTVTFDGTAFDDSAANVAELTGSGASLTAPTIGVATTVAGVAAVNEVQTLNLGDMATGDTTKFTYSAVESATTLDFDTLDAGADAAARAAIVQGVLENIAALTGNVTVAETIENTAYTVTFGGSLAATNVGLISCTSAVGFTPKGDGGYTDGFIQTTQGVAPVNEVQTVTLTDGPTGGTFTITFDGQTTSAIAYNASTAAADAAFEALSNVGAGNAAVVRTGSGTQASPYVYTITFGGTLAGQNVAEVTASGTSLTASTLTIATTTPGAADGFTFSVTEYGTP